jgi:hypothetical protein
LPTFLLPCRLSSTLTYIDDTGVPTAIHRIILRHVSNKKFQKHACWLPCYLPTKSLVSQAEATAVYIRLVGQAEALSVYISLVSQTQGTAICLQQLGEPGRSICLHQHGEPSKQKHCRRELCLVG